MFVFKLYLYTRAVENLISKRLNLTQRPFIAAFSIYRQPKYKNSKSKKAQFIPPFRSGDTAGGGFLDKN
jgi:hypothetical protein